MIIALTPLCTKIYYYYDDRHVTLQQRGYIWLDWLLASSYPEPLHTLTLCKRVFGWLYKKDPIYMNRYKISHFKTI
jgi:uncharacterized protein Usg